VTRRFRQIFAGITALASLTALFFAMLKWRVDTPETRLNFGRVAAARANNE
jgi:hypothetical protein